MFTSAINFQLYYLASLSFQKGALTGVNHIPSWIRFVPWGVACVITSRGQPAIS